MLKEALQLVVQYGLSTVLLFVAMWAYYQLHKQRDKERKDWDAERAALLVTWSEERRRLIAERLEESDQRVGDAQKYGESLMRSQEIQLSMVSKTSEITAQANQRERELKEELREREMRPGRRIT